MPAAEAELESRAAITALIGQEDAAWNSGDAAAFAARALPQIVFTNIVGMFSVGRETFEAQHARIFATIYKGSTLKQAVVHVTFVGPDVAIVDTLAEVAGFHSLPPGVQAVDGRLRTRIEQVVVRTDAAWWIASFHNVAINAPAIENLKPPRQ